MHTIYGIYVPGSEHPIYIGRTCQYLKRLEFHKSQGLRILKGIEAQGRFIETIYDLKALLMQMHRLGDIELEFHPIAFAQDEAEADRIEWRAIKLYTPILNTVVRIKQPKAPKQRKPIHYTIRFYNSRETLGVLGIHPPRSNSARAWKEREACLFNTGLTPHVRGNAVMWDRAEVDALDKDLREGRAMIAKDGTITRVRLEKVA